MDFVFLASIQDSCVTGFHVLKRIFESKTSYVFFTHVINCIAEFVSPYLVGHLKSVII
jgi:hypothetical protein